LIEENGGERIIDGKIKALEKKIQDHEKRISELERAVFIRKAKPRVQEFKGLSGGIGCLISKGFLNSPRSVKEIHAELGKEGYHYSVQAVDKILRVDFMAKRKILTRIKENNIWRYVVRK